MTLEVFSPLTSYNNADDSYIPDFTLRASIDWLSLSYIHLRFLNPICDLLSANGFKRTKKNPLSKGKFNRTKTYCDNDISIQLFYDMRFKGELIPTTRIEIHDPSKEILHLFHSYFSKFSIFHKLSQVELTFDFYTENLEDFQEFLDNKLYLRYQKQKSFNIEDTFYTTDIRTATKGTRTYLKPEDNPEFVRMELVLSRRVIKRLGLSLPLSNIDALNLKQFFIFAYIDSNMLTNYIVRKNKQEIKRVNQRRPGYGNIIKQTIHQWVRGITHREYESEFIKQIESLKDKDRGVPNYGRFIVEHELLTNAFMHKLSKTSFIPTTGKEYIMPDSL
ncbi:MAG: hypothetical protein ACLP2P_04020 [Desulfobaccales bacterium]